MRLARVEEDKVAHAEMDTQEVQLVDEAKSKTGSPRSIVDSDASGDSNASSNVIAALYFLVTSLPLGSDTVSDDENGTNVPTCDSLSLGTDAGCESVGSSAEVV